MGIPHHLTCLLRNLYAGQEATVRTGHGTTDWFKIGKGVHQGCILSPCLFNFFFLILFNFKILYWFCHISMNLPQVYTCSPSWTLLPPPYPYHPSGSSQCTSPKHPVLCIEPGLATRFIYDIIHISVPFSQIIPPFPSPTESKRLFYTSVSLLLSRIQGYCCHLSKFHIYALVYCIGIFLSGLLHSV